ncbi:hypothetical protein DdX_03876 [Ditylenchus destructor]|uniref:Helitron helicase-like domain-containing protein n=1 Tax=Ditylenchus destructor TaxID=166010 RepID=A0AAD4NAW3_9BILA|nr:hypothetical protein DdX_03876 [Ditylenchus destructor]
MPPPKKSKPQVPMETRSRAKAKKNAETQPPVDAKRSRTDNRQAADEDDAPRREKTSECYKSENLKVDCFSRLLPRSDAVLNKIALNNSEMLQSVDINSETALDSRYDHSGMSNSQLALGCENDFLNLDTDFTVNNAVQLLNEMYNKWLETNSRSSTADTSIKAFISHCNINDPEIFETLSSNAGVDSDALIAAFENGTNLNAIVSNDDPSNPICCEADTATQNIDNTSVVKCRVFDQKAKTRNDLPPVESNEVAAVYVTNTEGEVPKSYVTVYQTNGAISNFSTLSEYLDPMSYPLFYPNGETGPLDIHNSNFNPVHFGEKLLHQWGVDMWTRIEGDLLEFQKKKNSSMKSAKAANVEQSFVDEETDDIARKHILYSDYPGSIKYYQEQFRKSMIMAKRFGPPDLFITITFGSDNEDLKKQTNFRPDMVARAFELIYSDFIELIWKNEDNGKPTFGEMACYKTMFVTMNEKQKEFFTMVQEGSESSALHERVILTPLNKDANDICDEEMLSLLNKRALSSSLAGFAELAVGTAWTSLLGNFASPDPINCRKHKASLHALFPGSSLDNSSLALQHLLLWLNSV